MAMKHHPDRNAGIKKRKKFKEAAEAYEVWVTRKKTTLRPYGHEGLRGTIHRDFHESMIFLAPL